MHLIELVDYKVEPSEELFLIKGFRDLYNEDKSENKEQFFQMLSYVYYMADPRSSLSYVTDDKERMGYVLEQEGIKKLDQKKANILIEEYKRHIITSSYLLLQDTKLAVDKVREFLRGVDLNERDDKTGKPIYTINSITSAIKQCTELTKTLREQEIIIAKEIDDSTSVRGGTETMNMFEQGDD